ncbi:MAG: hypothetical protein DI536_24565 [Archangium gephyra]|uniref:Uncharacterized protein n=1 Tax=Archangium gephyra TaxID=48 RepID=A0A2W5TB98_9BACT|nr:MAG: hypothetical protein DI536_24565 [Archangium gephyra]
MRWAAALLVWLTCTALGAVIGLSLFFAHAPSGPNGLLGALFVAPSYGIIGGLLGALGGLIPGAAVFRRFETP